MTEENEGLKDWKESPTRSRIKALSEVMHDIIAAAERQGFIFAEIMTALDCFQIEMGIKYNISYEEFEKGQVKLCEHYERIYKRHQDENRTD